MSDFGGARKKSNRQTHRQTSLFNAVLPSMDENLPGGHWQSLDLNIAAFDNSVLNYRGDENYTLNGMVNPDASLPPLGAFGKLSLKDNLESFHLGDGELLNLDSSYLDILDNNENSYELGAPMYMQDTPYVSGGLADAVLPEVSSLSSLLGRQSQGTLPPFEELSASLTSHQNSFVFPSDYQPNALHSGLDQTAYANYAHPSNVFTPESASLHYDEACGVRSSESPFQLPLDPSCPNTAVIAQAPSRKGYKHRHERVYGLPEEEQKRRNQALNNEASQLYRERKKLTHKDLESEGNLQEERKRELIRQYQMLLKMKGKLQQKLT